jgi:hypothetical protein
MISWVSVAVTMLASPASPGVAHSVSAEVLSPSLVVASKPEPAAEARVKSWVTRLAVIGPGRASSEAPSTVLLFVAVAPVGGTVGLRAIGTF